MSRFSQQYERYLISFEDILRNFCAEMNYRPSVLTESMRYSLLSGGKRIRPVLFFSALDLYGLNYKKESELALALECIHTYSLIHDDLPAMDNDDYRRGNPSNHKVYGEANAILAGDGLLSAAGSLLIEACAKGEEHLKAARYLMNAAGAEGMIAGQSADLYYEGKPAGEEELFFIYGNKTAKLIAAPLVAAALIAGRETASAEEFGKALGILFQLTDDILDVKGESGRLGKTTGKDEAEDKLTCIKLLGEARSEELADLYAEKCLAALGNAENAWFLRDLVRFIRERDC